ncbi:MAG: D-cysteine desulfhydrase family protein [Pseudomonadota bacterium]
MQAFPRLALARLPTPLEALPRLGANLGVALFVKRDDDTGLGMGGNKLRKLEFLLGEAQAQGADVVLTVGALQSNHARQTAAACARLGLACELILRRPRQADDSYLRNGNVLLDRLLGARLIIIDASESREAAMAERAAQLQAEGRRPYCIPVGGSCPVGNLGYVHCARELLADCRQAGIDEAVVIVPTGSGGTQAGLVAGLHVLGSSMSVIGIAVEGTRAEQEAAVFAQAQATAQLLGAPPLSRERVVVRDEFVGPGYAKPTEAMREALALAARSEALVLDPVYTGKAMAGLIGLVRAGELPSAAAAIFVHTGGAPGLFAFPGVISV